MSFDTTRRKWKKKKKRKNHHNLRGSAKRVLCRDGSYYKVSQNGRMAENENTIPFQS